MAAVDQNPYQNASIVNSIGYWLGMQLGLEVVKFVTAKKPHVLGFRVGLLKACLVMLQTKNQTPLQRGTLVTVKCLRPSGLERTQVEKKKRVWGMVK